MQSIKTIIFEKSEHTTLSDLESSPERSSSSNAVSQLSLQRHTTPWSWFKKLKSRNTETWDKSKSLLSKSRLPESELSLNYLNKLPEPLPNTNFSVGSPFEEKVLPSLIKAQENMGIDPNKEARQWKTPRNK